MSDEAKDEETKDLDLCELCGAESDKVRKVLFPFTWEWVSACPDCARELILAAKGSRPTPPENQP